MREGAGLKQGDLGAQLGHDQSWCARIENCISSIEVHEIEAWAAACRVSAALSYEPGVGSSLLSIVPELDEAGRALLRRTAVALVLHPPARRRLEFDLQEWEAGAAADALATLNASEQSATRAR